MEIKPDSNGKYKVPMCSLRSIGPCLCDGEHYSMGFCDAQNDCRYKHVMELTAYEYACVIVQIKAMGR